MWRCRPVTSYQLSSVSRVIESAYYSQNVLAALFNWNGLALKVKVNDTLKTFKGNSSHVCCNDTIQNQRLHSA
jgi:hypothetical protein